MPILKKHKFTVDDLLDIQHVFEENTRVELIQGEIFDMSPINPVHANCVNRLTRFLTKHLSEEYMVSVQNSIQLSAETLPQPDLVITSARLLEEDRFIQAAEVILLIEVADSTYRIDSTKKRDLYANAGIHEYWVVNVQGKSIDVYQQAVAGSYMKTERYQEAFQWQGLYIDPKEIIL